MNAVTKIEAPGIHAAIAAAMGEVQRIGKSERNSHGNYNFAGIDAFLDLTRPICAKHGLNVLQDEEGFEVFEVPSAKGPQKMLLMRFAFTVARDGEAIGPLHRSIMVPASMGSQAFGSAQSYALKQFLRSLFQISTGEKDQDIDAHDTGELAAYQRPLIDDAQWALLVQLIEQSKADTQAFCTAYNIGSLKELPADAFPRAKAQLEKKLAALVKENA